MTQRASWRERSASSTIKWFAPLTRMDTVFPGLGTPVTLITYDLVAKEEEEIDKYREQENK